MPARASDLDRLASARPPILASTELLVSRTAEDEILRTVLAERRPQARRRTPRLAVVATAGLAAAAVAAAGLFAVGAGQRGTTRPPSPSGAAASQHANISVKTVADRVSVALGSASASGVIFYDTSFAPSVVAGGIASIREWTFGQQEREQAFTSSGSLVQDASAVVSGSKRIRRFVNYADRTWETDSTPVSQVGPAPSPSQVAATLLGVARGDVPRATTGGTPAPMTVTAVTVDGTKMLRVAYTELTSKQRPLVGPVALPFTDAQFLPPAGPAYQPRTVTTWIDAATYLPVRVTAADASGRVLFSETIALLPSSGQNLAEFAPAPVPAGFRLTAELGH